MIADPAVTRVTFIWFENILFRLFCVWRHLPVAVFSGFTPTLVKRDICKVKTGESTEHMVLSSSEREELLTHLSRPWPSNNSTFLKEKNRRACEKRNIASLVIWELSLLNCRYVKPVILEEPEKIPVMREVLAEQGLGFGNNPWGKKADPYPEYLLHAHCQG